MSAVFWPTRAPTISARPLASSSARPLASPLDRQGPDEVGHDAIQGFVERLRAGEAAFDDEAGEGRSRSLGVSLGYGFEHVFEGKAGSPERSFGCVDPISVCFSRNRRTKHQT